ncbi:MAG: hypothetical protein A2744_00650 [Candidatus Buchananbacteria bacterium RIFCSPHIGHO2_01_FULL_44_11]|uniref:Uncharacterized protein n=1 Tax=Candidatus Buchananbacteria bacterium RIFCSPHIGHO2_01_FULL_44_11 TaxID=1797535 RepID=A0A1G1XYP4_9BACT|nr:MAG: hypothetical protein A2744_00650 [Candidatus Buchananbacteria bacterium RIFCSPHIGHO2_01_FULL_44_11]
MKKLLLQIICLISLVSFAFLPIMIIAAEEDDKNPASPSLAGDINQQLQPVGDVYGQTGTISESSLAETVAEIIKAVLALLGIIFIALMVYAGFMWMTSAGNEDRVEKAKKTIVAAVIGTVIIICAYIITAFVINSLQSATAG